MIRTTIRELKTTLNKYVDKDYYLLWAFEESRIKGANYVEFFFSIKPVVSIVIEQNIIEPESIVIHGVKVYVRKNDIPNERLEWNDMVKIIREKFLNYKNTEVFRESEDYIYIILGSKSINNLHSTIEYVREALGKVGFKISKKLIGYDYAEVI